MTDRAPTDWFKHSNSLANKMRSALERLEGVENPNHRTREAIHTLIRGLKVHDDLHKQLRSRPAYTTTSGEVKK